MFINRSSLLLIFFINAMLAKECFTSTRRFMANDSNSSEPGVTSS